MAGEGARDAALDLTPRAVAQYLVMTGDFSGFSDAIEELISTSIVSQLLTTNSSIKNENSNSFKYNTRTDWNFCFKSAIGGTSWRIGLI